MQTGRNEVSPWRVSLHGGHSGEFCDHADGTLRAMLEAAVAAGFHTFGVSEHVPRPERFLYREERARGWDAAKIAADFARYMSVLPALAEEFADRLIVLRGFEAEVVPTTDYAEQMQLYRSAAQPDGSPVFDYFVGSVHYVREIQIDGHVDEYLRAVEACGGIEELAIDYYQTVIGMVKTLRPDVVGHLDLIKKNLQAAGFSPDALQTPAVFAAIDETLETICTHNGILDLNTAGWRKGLGEPYPSPWLVRRAHAGGIPFCFGDDSHRPTDVGAGIDAARDYLLQQGVSAITVISRNQSQVGCRL